jgi:small-conductance mechanosensitive channel
MWEHLNQALSQSTDRIINGVADFLPGVLALLVAVILSLPLAWIVSRLLRRSLRSIRFDDRLHNWGITALAEWSPSRSPTLLLDRIAYWTILFLGLLVGLTALNAQLTSHLATRAIEYLPNLLAAVLVLAVGNLVARFLARGALISAVNMQMGSARFISLGVKWLILVCAAAMALDQLGIGGAIVRLAFAILFGGIVLAVALAVGLGSKDVVARAWERRKAKASDESSQPFQHL